MSKTTVSNTKAKGYILYKGYSELNMQPIVAIMTMQSSNEKTGNIPHIWILPDIGLKPSDSARAGKDSSVCGNCPHRPKNLGTCYVTLFHGPRAVYASYKRGIYPELDLFTETGQAELDAILKPYDVVRLGTYGDGLSLPDNVLWCLKDAMRHGKVLSYTHQYAQLKARYYIKDTVMVSCDSIKHAKALQAKGLRYFRVAPLGDDTVLPNEIRCPYYENGTQCRDCRLCDGTRYEGDDRPSIVVTVHGKGDKRFTQAMAKVSS